MSGETFGKSLEMEDMGNEEEHNLQGVWVFKSTKIEVTASDVTPALCDSCTSK